MVRKKKMNVYCFLTVQHLIERKLPGLSQNCVDKWHYSSSRRHEKLKNWALG